MTDERSLWDDEPDYGHTEKASMHAPKQRRRNAAQQPTEKGPSQRDKLITVTDQCKLWQCPDGVAHATLQVSGHVEYHRVRSQQFRNWLLVAAGRKFPMVVAGKQ